MKSKSVTIAGAGGKASGVHQVLRLAWAGCAIATLATMSPAIGAGDADAGAQKAYTCLGCHGIKHYINTYPTYHVPRIAGQHEQYLVSALQAYRAMTRAHPTMQANAALLTDQDIADLSAWFASQGGS